MNDTYKLLNPGGQSSTEIEFGLGIPLTKWSDRLIAVWVHQHRLIGLASEDSVKAAQQNRPFYLHKVCTWISQVGVMPTREGNQVQSVRVLVRYDNMDVPLEQLLITQNHAILRVSEEDKKFQDWVLTSYKQQVLPSNLQLARTMPGQKPPGPGIR